MSTKQTDGKTAQEEIQQNEPMKAQEILDGMKGVVKIEQPRVVISPPGVPCKLIIETPNVSIAHVTQMLDAVRNAAYWEFYEKPKLIAQAKEEAEAQEQGEEAEADGEGKKPKVQQMHRSKVK